MQVQTATKKEVIPFLGISAKSTNQKQKPQTEIAAKKLRYALQRTAQSLLFDPNLHYKEKQHRVCSCHRNVASDGVAIYRQVDGNNARFGNLISCGSVWSCPVCSAKITESRREDMQKAQSAWLMDGGSCLLMTLTFPHESDMPLDELLEKFANALDHYKNSKTYKRIFGTAHALINQKINKGKPLKNIIKGEFSRLGTVRSLEVTHGVNGWHPHVHEVLFMGDDALLHSTRAKDELTHQWVISLRNAGLGSHDKLESMYQHSFDIRGGDFVSDYIHKFGREPLQVNGWTIAHEVTKANSKMGKNARKIGDEYHYTPFQLLAFAAEGDAEAAKLFKEFSKCFEGKRMNYWTNGLKDWFSINEVEDEALADESVTEEPQEEFVIRLDTLQWKEILETNTRFEVLQAAALDGHDGVMRFLETLPDRPKIYKGWFKDNARPNFTRFFH